MFIDVLSPSSIRSCKRCNHNFRQLLHTRSQPSTKLHTRTEKEFKLASTWWATRRPIVRPLSVNYFHPKLQGFEIHSSYATL